MNNRPPVRPRTANKEPSKPVSRNDVRVRVYDMAKDDVNPVRDFPTNIAKKDRAIGVIRAVKWAVDEGYAVVITSPKSERLFSGDDHI